MNRAKVLFQLLILNLLILGFLLWSVAQIGDPKTQRTFLEVAGQIIIVMTILAASWGQNVKFKKLIEFLLRIIN